MTHETKYQTGDTIRVVRGEWADAFAPYTPEFVVASLDKSLAGPVVVCVSANQRYRFRVEDVEPVITESEARVLDGNR